jgi:hypothetical protein
MASRYTRCHRAIVALALLAVTGTAQADVSISANARRHFKEGVRYLTTHEADRFEKAYAQFRAAYADSPSWKILGNLGIVAEALERDGEAIEAYRGYLEGGAKELKASEREQFKSDLNRLELNSAEVTVEVVPDGAWIIDERAVEEGKPVVNRYGPSSGSTALRLRAGRHRLHAELDGHSSPTWEFEALPGGNGAHSFDLRPPQAPPPPVAHPEPITDEREDARPAPSGNTGRVLGYSALGLGAVGTGLGTYFLIQGYQRRSEGEAAYSRCMVMNQTTCPASDAKQQEETSSRIRSGISFGVAGAMFATGVLLLVYSGSSDDASEASLTPWVGPREIGITGTF